MNDQGVNPTVDGELKVFVGVRALVSDFRLIVGIEFPAQCLVFLLRLRTFLRRRGFIEMAIDVA